jgi:hypothetical protein
MANFVCGTDERDKKFILPFFSGRTWMNEFGTPRHGLERIILKCTLRSKLIVNITGGRL